MPLPKFIKALIFITLLHIVFVMAILLIPNNIIDNTVLVTARWCRAGVEQVQRFSCRGGVQMQRFRCAGTAEMQRWFIGAEVVQVQGQVQVNKVKVKVK